MQHQNGFTLIELMIVVAIVSILTTLALPRFEQFQRRTVDTQTLAHLNNMSRAVELYNIEHNGPSPACASVKGSIIPGNCELVYGPYGFSGIDTTRFSIEVVNGVIFVWAGDVDSSDCLGSTTVEDAGTEDESEPCFVYHYTVQTGDFGIFK